MSKLPALRITIPGDDKLARVIRGIDGLYGETPEDRAKFLLRREVIRLFEQGALRP